MKTVKFETNKLVRDKIIDKLKLINIKCEYSVMNDLEYLAALKEKIVEEAKEVLVSQIRENLIEEIADLQEVIYALCKVENISMDSIENVRQKKVAEKGAFNEKIFMKSFIMAEDHPDIANYRDKKIKIVEKDQLPIIDSL